MVNTVNSFIVKSRVIKSELTKLKLMSFSRSSTIMSLQLVPSVRRNISSIFSRAISLDSTKYCKRDIIAVDYKAVEDVATHTGQKFEPDDSRRVRFINAKKYVNPNIAMELIAKVPPIPSKDKIVWCDGGDEHLGHPKVYINLDKPGDHTCGYCGLRFYKEDSHH